MARQYETGFHGTDNASATSLHASDINVTVGRGELGQGFYLGDQLHVAKAWAWNKHNRSTSVLEVKVPRQSFSRLGNIVCLTGIWARPAAQPAYVYGCDVIYAPIMGGLGSVRSYIAAVNSGWVPWHPRYLYKGSPLWMWGFPPHQSKWESQPSQDVLNNPSTLRSII
jgi:hypothetical protein